MSRTRNGWVLPVSLLLALLLGLVPLPASMHALQQALDDDEVLGLTAQ